MIDGPVDFMVSFRKQLVRINRGKPHPLNEGWWGVAIPAASKGRIHTKPTRGWLSLTASVFALRSLVIRFQPEPRSDTAECFGPSVFRPLVLEGRRQPDLLRSLPFSLRPSVIALGSFDFNQNLQPSLYLLGCTNLSSNIVSATDEKKISKQYFNTYS